MLDEPLFDNAVPVIRLAATPSPVLSINYFDEDGNPFTFKLAMDLEKRSKEAERGG